MVLNNLDNKIENLSRHKMFALAFLYVYHHLVNIGHQHPKSARLDDGTPESPAET